MGKRDSTVSVRRMLKGSCVACRVRGGVVDVGDRVIGDALQNARQSYDTHTVVCVFFQSSVKSTCLQSFPEQEVRCLFLSSRYAVSLQ